MKSALTGIALACLLCVSFALAIPSASAENFRKVDRVNKADRVGRGDRVERAAPQLVSLLGKEVTTARDGDGGRVIDILVDAQGRIRAAVVEFGGFLGIGTRKIAVDWNAFRFYEAAIQVEITREQIRASPEYKVDQPPAVLRPAKN